MCTCVPGELSADSHVALTGLQAVDGADVVQTAAGYEVSRRRVRTRHHPRRAQRDGMDLPNQRHC